MIYAETFIRTLFPSRKDHFPWLHLTTGTILSIASLIQTDWIHCSAILMDVLWSFLPLNSHLKLLFNLRVELPLKNINPLSSESSINQLPMSFVGPLLLNETALFAILYLNHNGRSSNWNLYLHLYKTRRKGNLHKVLQILLSFHCIIRYMHTSYNQDFSQIIFLTRFILAYLTPDW